MVFWAANDEVLPRPAGLWLHRITPHEVVLAKACQRQAKPHRRLGSRAAHSAVCRLCGVPESTTIPLREYPQIAARYAPDSRAHRQREKERQGERERGRDRDSKRERERESKIESEGVRASKHREAFKARRQGQGLQRSSGNRF